jgi:hypothetical protein
MACHGVVSAAQGERQALADFPWQQPQPFYLMIQYEPDWLQANLSKIGFRDIEIRLFQVTGDPGEKHLDSHVLARKGWGVHLW